MTGQQQGREAPEHNERHDDGLWTCVWQRAGQDCLMHGPAPSSAPPTRDSGRDEARERDTQVDKTVPLDEACKAVARWRAGRKVGRTIYAQAGPEPSDDDALIGVMDTAELAQAAVDGHNWLLDGAR